MRMRRGWGFCIHLSREMEARNRGLGSGRALRFLARIPVLRTTVSCYLLPVEVGDAGR